MKTITINGKTWIYSPTEALDQEDQGECKYMDPQLGGLLHIDTRQAGPELLDTLVHEWLHALLPHAKEEWVTEEAANLVELIKDKEILTRIGLFNKITVSNPKRK